MKGEIVGHIRDTWTVRGDSGRRVKGPRWGKGNRWLARWTTPDGREHSRAFASRDAAQEYLARVEVSARDGEWVVDEVTTLDEWAARWRSRQVQHRDSTAQTRDRHLDHMLLDHLGHRPVASLTRGEVADLVASWTAAPATQRVAWSYVAAMLRAARDERLTRVDLTAGVRLPQVVQSPVVPLTAEQVAAMAQHVPARLAAAVWLAAGTGLRPGEWRGLTADRVRMIAGVPHVIVDRQLVDVARGGRPVWGPPKTESSHRRVSLAPSTYRVLAEHLQVHPPGEHQLVFVRPRTGLPLTRSDIQGVWQRAATKAGVVTREREGWHALRHHHASLLIAAGLSPRAVADRLGHRDVMETMRTYAHLWHDDDERARQAVEDALGGL